MQYTSAEASKLLKKLNMEYDDIVYNESQGSTFLAATGEDPESVRPYYNYEETKAKLEELSSKIIAVKHAINLFNTSHMVPGFDMTIDQMLVFMPQLNLRVAKLKDMKNQMPKVREKSYGSGPNATIDYRYTNYDIKKVAADYEEAYEMLCKAQNALDLINTTEKMEITL